MAHDFRSHSPTFRQREFWLDHESPGTRHKTTMLLCVIIFLSIALLFSLLMSTDNTEFATLEQVKKIEAHLYQLEERLVWTDEKIDTIQASTETPEIQPVIDNTYETDNETLETTLPKESVLEIHESMPEIEKKQPEIPKQSVVIKQPETTDVAPEPKNLPVIHPKIKKKKINRRDFGIIYKYHKVRQGETLYRIGLKYDVSVSEIRRLNRLSANDSIHPGQRLLVSQGMR
jgi:LysM repeat protein